MTSPSDAKALRSFIRRLCHDVLQRSPSPREAKVYLGASQASVICHLMRSRDAMRLWLEDDLLCILQKTSLPLFSESFSKGFRKGAAQICNTYPIKGLFA